jgi:hypothetical protein
VDSVQDGFSVVRLDVTKAPSAITTPGGYFVFEDVVPGNYALVYETPTDTYLAQDATGRDVIARVGEGETVDLGQLAVPMLQ